MILPCGLRTELTVKGKAIGPEICLINRDKQEVVPILDFGNIEIKRSVTKSIILKNKSTVPVQYHIQCEKKGCFQIECVNGEVQPQLSTIVYVTFTPKYPINYYRKVYILIENNAPIFVEIFGSGFNETLHPATITHDHIKRFKRRQELGLSQMSIPELEEEMKKNRKRAEYLLNSDDSELIEYNSKLDVNGTIFNWQLELLKEIFQKSTTSNIDMKLNKDVIDFGTVNKNKGTPKETFTYTNNTNSKILIHWILPSTNDSIEFQRSEEFSIYPEVVEVRPKEVFEFTVIRRNYNRFTSNQGEIISIIANK